MVPSSLDAYLRCQRICLVLFRFSRWWFINGLESMLIFSRVLWGWPLMVAYYLHSAKLAWATDICALVYLFVYPKVIHPRMTDWFIGRHIICEDMFVKKILRIVAHCQQIVPSIKVMALLEGPGLNLRKEEVRLLKTRLKSSEILEEVVLAK